jgi:di/tricarboxylate transporter
MGCGQACALTAAESMNSEQALAFGILAATFVLFVWARWRYDVVALLALLAVTLTGLVSPADAFAGFAHPAVLTVAAVLVISRALQNAGIVDVVVKAIAPLRGRETLQIAAQTTAVAVISSFMNNVGALALMLPVALRNAHREGYPPAKSLMALAFGSLLGGMTTLIGTPPNLIVSLYRQERTGAAFGMFDFTPVGAAVAMAGVLFLIFIGWRLLPLNDRAGDKSRPFKIEDYVTEAKVPEESKAANATVYELEELTQDEITIVGIVRDGSRVLAPAGYQRVRAGEILILRGEAESLKSAVEAMGLQVADNQQAAKDLQSDEIGIVEAVVSPGSRLIGRTPISMRLRTMFGLNLLALARQGRSVPERLGDMRFQSGDVVMLQGPTESMNETLGTLQLLPLAERDHGIGRPRRLILSTGIFAGAIVFTIADILPVHVSFVAAAVAMVVANIVKPDEAYQAIDWPVIVLLGAMFPVGGALESTGGAALVANSILYFEGLGTFWILLILLVVTMFVSDVINNNATAILMLPIAMILAERLGANPDAFLMAVAIGASSAFLTPIGHQSNALVLEPGGYKFGDYWRMGLPLEVVIVAVAMPLLMLFWPP